MWNYQDPCAPRNVTPELHLRTGLVLDARGRIVSTREPGPAVGPQFSLIRGAASCAWAVHADVAEPIARELGRLASEETPLPAHDLRQPPRHAAAYRALLGELTLVAGPMFAVPDELPDTSAFELFVVDRLELLTRHFRGWNAAELPERAPIVAIVKDGYPVSVCFCARGSDEAAAAGVETAAAFRGRGFAPVVTAAWARSIRATGRLPLYSTSWDNAASLAVARKLGLVPSASSWNLGA